MSRQISMLAFGLLLVCVPAFAQTTKSCYSNYQCKSTEYCAKTIGNCGGLGVCTIPPKSCSPTWNPVCGCNDQTYVNSCYAAKAKVNVDSMGECDCGEYEAPTTWPTSGYYLLMTATGDEYFYVWVTSVDGINHIDDWLAAGPLVDTLGIPGAQIELSSTYNPGYSYRMQPNEVIFAPWWVEVCDATPCYVELDPVTWYANPGLWCPWSAVVATVWDCSGGSGATCGTPVFEAP